MGIQEKSWVDLGEGEEVLWWNHPHILHYAAEIIMGIGLFFAGIILLFVEIEMVELSWYPILLSLFGIVYAVYQFYRRSFHYYVITSNKLIERRGILYETRNPVHFNRIAKTNLTRSMGEKVISFHPRIDIANIFVKTAGTDGAEMILYDVPKADEVAKLIEERIVGSGNNSSATQTGFGNGGNHQQGGGHGHNQQQGRGHQQGGGHGHNQQQGRGHQQGGGNHGGQYRQNPQNNNTNRNNNQY